MTNENNNINELVSTDDDPTAELEILPDELSGDPEAYLEADASTYDAIDELRSGAIRRKSLEQFEVDLRASKISVDRLQFDAEQLNAKVLGLESEVDARDNQTQQLIDELAELRHTLARKQKLIKKRDRKIRSLKSEIRQREEEHQALISDFGELEKLNKEPRFVEESPSSATNVLRNEMPDDLLRRLDRSNEYADTLRRQLQDILETTNDTEADRKYLQRTVAETAERNSELEAAVKLVESRAQEMQSRLDSIATRHQTEIRLLRFELGAAQDTMAESENINTELTANLIVARGNQDDLQHSLSDAEESTRHEVTRLENELKKLEVKINGLEQKISTKSEAITVLLGEIAKRSAEHDAARDSNDSAFGPEDADEKRSNNTERVSRVLVGSIDGQILRFPLFKDQLTIGRTEDNDIQLEAAHISRRHAVVQTEGDTTRVIDWGSKNGVFVNAKKVSEHFLINGDVVTIGNARFRYEERKKRDL